MEVFLSREKIMSPTDILKMQFNDCYNLANRINNELLEEQEREKALLNVIQ